MPSEPMPRKRSRPWETLNLPPPFTVATAQGESAFTRAQGLAGLDTAGTLVLVERTEAAEFALILEASEPLETARSVHYAGMVAIANALATLIRPQAITLGWPGEIRLGERVIGGARLDWPDNADERAVPDWLVFGATISLTALTVTGLPRSAGHDSAPPAERLIQLFARYFLAALNHWSDHGFGALAQDYVQRLPAEAGTRYEITPTGDLIVYDATGEGERYALALALGSSQPGL